MKELPSLTNGDCGIVFRRSHAADWSVTEHWIPAAGCHTQLPPSIIRFSVGM